jgi:anti-sigma regulatory factor (Ser/Thr protein kinase)
MILNVLPTGREIQEAAKKVANFGLSAGMCKQSCFQLRVVISEVLNNVAEHACSDIDEQLVQIQCLIDDHQITIISIDNGSSLNVPPTGEFPPPLSEGGRGWPIILNWIDTFKYQSDKTGNYLTLHKNRS